MYMCIHLYMSICMNVYMSICTRDKCVLQTCTENLHICGLYMCNVF